MGPLPYIKSKGMRVKIKGLFKGIWCKEHKDRENHTLSHSYIEKIPQIEKDAFVKFVLNKGYDLDTFMGWDDTRAMLFINQFRSTEWYRKYAEMRNLYANLDPQAEVLYNAREGAWRGSVEISTSSRSPSIKGVCCHCGKQMVDYDHCFTIDDRPFCFTCFSLLKKFTPIMTHHYPGCVDNGNSFEFHVWDGWDDFIKRYPPEDGWHYEWSRTHLMTVKDDQSEWWVVWNIHHPDIMKEIMEHCLEWHWSNIRSE